MIEHNLYKSLVAKMYYSSHYYKNKMTIVIIISSVISYTILCVLDYFVHYVFIFFCLVLQTTLHTKTCNNNNTTMKDQLEQSFSHASKTSTDCGKAGSFVYTFTLYSFLSFVLSMLWVLYCPFLIVTDNNFCTVSYNTL